MKDQLTLLKKTYSMSETTTQEGRLNTFLNSTVVDLFTTQYFHELDNCFIYKFFATWAGTKGYEGAHKWYQHQSEEELSHANKIRDFLTDAGVYFSIQDIPITPIEIQEYKDLFKAALLRETQTTDSINNIMYQCGVEKQLLAQEFMNQLLYNQLSEEEEARTRYQISLHTEDSIVADMQINELN